MQISRSHPAQPEIMPTARVIVPQLSRGPITEAGSEGEGGKGEEEVILNTW